MSDLIVIDEQVSADTLKWLNGPPKTWSLWGCTLVHVRPLNRWRMKQQRVRERRELRAKFAEVRNKMVARRALGSAEGPKESPH